jgi:hypothetical protein
MRARSLGGDGRQLVEFSVNPPHRVLDAMERISQILFDLIMATATTSSLPAGPQG